MGKAANPEYLETRAVELLLVEISTPAIIATVISAAYNFFARIFVGQKLGMIGITALTVSFPATLVMLAFAMMVGPGASTLSAIYLGERRNDKAEEILGQALTLYIFFFILFLILGLTFLDPLLMMFGASEEVLVYARPYMTWLLWGIFFQEISFGVNNFIRVEGRPVIAMVAMLIAVPVNLLLTWFFLYRLEMGIAGAGLATLIAQGVSSVWVCWYYLSGQTVLKWRWKYLIPKFSLLARICLFGTVPLVTQGCGALIHGLQYNLLGFYGREFGEQVGLAGINGGDLAVGLTGTISTIAMLVVMPLLGLGQGMQPIVGYNTGAKRPDRVWRTLLLSLLAGTALATFCWCITMFWPHVVLNFFVRSDDPAYIEIMRWGAAAVRIIMFGAPLVAVSILCGAYFQAHGRPILSLSLSLMRQLLFLVPFLFLFPWICDRFQLTTGLVGCWLAFPASDILAALIVVLLLIREYRIKKQAIVQMPPERKT